MNYVSILIPNPVRVVYNVLKPHSNSSRFNGQTLNGSTSANQTQDTSCWAPGKQTDKWQHLQKVWIKWAAVQHEGILSGCNHCAICSYPLVPYSAKHVPPNLCNQGKRDLVGTVASLTVRGLTSLKSLH